MSEGDGYTKTIRDWFVVKEAIRKIKSDWFDFADELGRTGKFPVDSPWDYTDPMWKPNLSNSRLAETSGKSGHRQFVQSPPGTDPADCLRELSIFLGALASSAFSSRSRVLLTNSQTDGLFRGAVGSFTIFTTVDNYDGAAKSATLNFWMFNAMTRSSFGRYANEPLVVRARCGMQSQYMWWNWAESISWNTGFVRTTKGWR